MTPQEANDMLAYVLHLKRYIDDQIISYDKHRAQEAAATLINALQEAIAGGGDE